MDDHQYFWVRINIIAACCSSTHPQEILMVTYMKVSLRIDVVALVIDALVVKCVNTSNSEHFDTIVIFWRINSNHTELMRNWKIRKQIQWYIKRNIGMIRWYWLLVLYLVIVMNSYIYSIIVILPDLDCAIWV